MTGFLATARRDSPTVEAAFHLATEWCAGHVIDGGPALGHAVRVTTTLGRHAPGAPVHVIAACLLHDAPDLAPNDEEMARRITNACGADVLAVITHLHAEHQVLADPSGVHTSRHLTTLATVPWLLHAATADKIVAFEHVTGLAANTPEADAFWASRPAFIRLLPYFHQVQRAGAGHLPPSMSAAYADLLARRPAPAAQP